MYAAADPASATPGSFVIISLAVTAFLIVSICRMFSKAGQPAWAALVPFYNVVVLLRICGKPAWWLVLMLIPFVNIIFTIIIALELADAFDKGIGFGIGLFLLPVVFVPILAWGN